MSTKDPITTKGDATLTPPDEQQPGGIGDNSEAEKAIFDKAVRQMIDLNAQRASLNASISKVRKGFKSDGLVLKHLDATIAMLEWSPSEIREHFATAQRYAGYAKLPVGAQIDLLANASDEEVAKADWRARGRNDAMRLKPASVPKGCPPEHVQDYTEGYHEARWWTDDKAPASTKVN